MENNYTIVNCFLMALRERHVLKPGRWTGRWTMDDGRWTMDDGRWTMDDGRWTMDDGRWTMDVHRPGFNLAHEILSK